MKYKTTVDAVQWDGENIKEIVRFVKFIKSTDIDDVYKEARLSYCVDKDLLTIKFAHNEKLSFNTGDYFVFDGEGRIYSKTEAEFKEQYEGVE